jgi:hypothetical protein
MPILISEFYPKDMMLFPKPEDADENWKAPIEGMEDVWIRVTPPTWESDRLRQAYINRERDNASSSFLDIFHYEIYLTFAGTNMVVEVPKVDEHNRVMWKDGKASLGPITEIVQFDEEGKLTIEEFTKRINKLPMQLVDWWHSRVLEVAPQWVPRFR